MKVAFTVAKLEINVETLKKKNFKIEEKPVIEKQKLFRARN